MQHPSHEADMGRPKGSKNTPEKIKFAIIELWKADVAHVAISTQLSISKSTVQRLFVNTSKEEQSKKKKEEEN